MHGRALKDNPKTNAWKRIFPSSTSFSVAEPRFSNGWCAAFEKTLPCGASMSLEDVESTASQRAGGALLRFFQNILFQGGIRVEELARTQYPTGVKIPHREIRSEEAALQTLDASTDHKTQAIFDGAFIFQNTFVRTDILKKTREGSWDLIEVKSTTRVRQSHQVDLALQLWILRSLGIDIARAGILTVNKGYNYLGGDIDLEQYFNFTDCSEELDDLMTQAERAVETFNVILNKEDPARGETGETMQPTPSL